MKPKFDIFSITNETTKWLQTSNLSDLELGAKYSFDIGMDEIEGKKTPVKNETFKLLNTDQRDLSLLDVDMAKIKDPNEEPSLHSFELLDELDTESKALNAVFVEHSEPQKQQQKIERKINYAKAMQKVDPLNTEAEMLILTDQLNVLSDIKESKFKSLHQSLNESGKIIREERVSQLIKILEDFINRDPNNNFIKDEFESLSLLDPEDRQSFLQAKERLCLALGALRNNNNSSFKTIRDYVLDSLTLWPKFKEDARVMLLMDRFNELIKYEITDC